VILLLVILLVIIALGAAPGIGAIPHGYNWAPSGVITVIVVILLILILTGRM
jgi:hypothetical protein